MSGRDGGAVRPGARIGFDVTPLVGQRTGVGQYVAGLLRGFGELRDEGIWPQGRAVALAAFTLRGHREAQRAAGALGWPTATQGRAVPARLLHAAWSRHDWPPVEALTGPLQLFHGTNNVLPPTRRAAGSVFVHDLWFLEAHAVLQPAVARYRELVPRSVARAAVVCTSTSIGAEALAATYHLPPERVAVTPLAIRSAFTTAVPPTVGWKAARGLPESYILFVGTQEPRKNLPVLLAAHRALRAANPDVPVLCVAGRAGWGPPLDIEGQEGDGIVRTGYLPDVDMPSLVAGARVLVLPSQDEGFGLPVLEAFACGVPVVTSDVPALREVAGGHALLVKPGDVEGLMHTLELALHSEQTDPAAVRARRAYAAPFTWRATAAATLAAWQGAGVW